jgi:hypothetical protein
MAYDRQDNPAGAPHLGPATKGRRDTAWAALAEVNSGPETSVRRASAGATAVKAIDSGTEVGVEINAFVRRHRRLMS